MVALQDRLRPGDLAAMVERAWSARESMINATGHFNNSDSVQLIIDLIQFHAKDH